MYGVRPPRQTELALEVAGLLADGLEFLVRKGVKSCHYRRRRGGKTLRPGATTPLWNELRRQLRRYVREYGMQAKLGRYVGLPRQRIHAFLTRGTEMPDAERTLELLVWLTATRAGRQPS